MARTREEQISRLIRPDNTCILLSATQLDVELIAAEQRGYERARAECAELCSEIGQTYRELSASGEIEATSKMYIGAFRCAQAIGDGETPRSAIDAAMKGDENV